MKTIEETKKWLLKNRVDKHGDLDLTCLDFSEFDGNVNISGMKVKGHLWQGWQEVKGDYYCYGIKVGGNISHNEPTKILKKITAEELAKMGYELEETK